MEEMDSLLTRLSLAGVEFSLLIREAMMNVDIRCFSSNSPDSFFQDRPLVFLENERGGVKTISAPHMIVTMLHHLELSQGMEVMVVGAKGGYISALINEIVGDKGGVTLLDYDSDVLNHACKSHKMSGYESTIQRRKLRRDGRSPANLPSKLSRVLVTGSIDSLPSWIESRIDEGGFAIFPRGGRINQKLIKREKQGDEFFDTDLGNVVFGPLDIKDSEPMTPSPYELADILEEVSFVAKDLDMISLENSLKLDDLITDLRSLPDDINFEIEDKNEMPLQMRELLEESGSWMNQLWPLFLMLSEVNIQQPGALFDDDDDDFGPHEDMIP
jgi:protein-L-isoaspartate O-methyltransferase